MARSAEQTARKLALESVFCVLASIPLSIIVYAAFDEAESCHLGPLLLAWGWYFRVSPWFILPRCLFLFGIWCGIRTMYVSRNKPRSPVVAIARILGVGLAVVLIVMEVLEPRMSQ